jgi:DNA-binding NarL/FixJ family response regulator
METANGGAVLKGGPVNAKLPVLIVSDFPMLRQSIAELIKSSEDMQVVASATSDSSATAIARTLREAVAIVDLDLQGDRLTKFVRDLSFYHVHVLLLRDNIDESKVAELFRLGLRGVISRKSTPEMIYQSVRAVAEGRFWPRATPSATVTRQTPVATRELSPAESLNALPPSTAKARNSIGLTRREQEVLQAICEGMNNKDIAQQFGISPFTVKHHVTHIFDKAGVYSRLELGIFALHHGWVESPRSRMEAF